MDEVFEVVDGLQDTDDIETLAQPNEIKKAQLRPYQLVGFSWIVSRWQKGLNCLLADDMGLGKTIQTISSLTHMKHTLNLRPPYLIICPLSLVENWSNEFTAFSPGFKVVRWVGTTEERDTVKKDIVQHILSQPRSQWSDPDVNFDVLITTYDFAIKDKDFFQRFKWRALVVDEAHRLKNANSKLFGALQELKRDHVLLLTGTPIQNSLQELFALLHFLMPQLFVDPATFIAHFKPLAQPGGGHGKLEEQLHRMLKPFLLRRERDQVLHDLPPKKEFIIYTPLSPMQREYYVSILKKDVSGVLKEDKRSLVNVLMNLRKACNHPYLFDGAEPEFDGEFQLGEHLVTASTKLLVLDKLLAKFKRDGDKVLIFSQMTRMLDIVQDYMHLRGFTYERLDGSVRGNERWLAVEQFSKAESDTFAFLLSTRAGGVGLNLTAASVVIFIDSDFNPQNDLQAQARCLRIGQKKEVSVIRLCCPHTVEEIIMARGHGKLRLNSRVLAKGQFSLGSGSGGNDDEDGVEHQDKVSLGEIVRFGVKQVLSDDKGAADAYAAISDEDIESILKKGTILNSSSAAVASTATPSQNVEVLPTGAEFEQTMRESEAQSLWLFDGHDYSADHVQADALALAALEGEADDDLGLLTPSRAKAAAKRASSAKKKAQASPAILDDEDADSGDDADERLARRLARKRSFAASTPTRSAKPRQSIEDDEDEDDEDLEVTTRRTGTRSRPAPPPGYTSMALHITEDEIDVLIKNGETLAAGATARRAADAAAAQGSLIVDNEGESDTGLSGDVADENSTCINLVTGDVTKPIGPHDRPKLVITTLDDSGSWGRGRLFDSLSRLCAAAPVQYSLAGQARELEMGSLHVVQCVPDDEDGSATPAMYLGMLICQHRNKSDGNLGPINMKRLQEGLWKACKWASQNGNATVHLPRIGATVPGTNWYSIERLIRGTLGKAHIESYVYYFARNGAGAPGGLQRRATLVSSTSSLSSSSGNIPAPSKRKTSASFDLDDFDAAPATLPTENPPAPRASSSSSATPGMKIALYRVGASMQQKIRQGITSQGSSLCPVLDEAEVVITSQPFDADDILVSLSEKGVRLMDAKTWVAQHLQ